MRVLRFPNLRQTYHYDCGVKAVQSVLAYYGFDVRADKIMKILGVTEIGTYVRGIKRLLKRYGLKYKAGQMTAERIKAYIDRGAPVIVPLQAWPKKEIADWENCWEEGHYAVVIGYDYNGFCFEDPSSFSRTYLTFEDFEKRWHDADDKGRKYINYGIAVYGGRASYDLKKVVFME